MQRQVARQAAPSLEPTEGERDRCPECGAEIEGVAATGGGHRFVGCGHTAKRFSVRADGPSLVGLSIE